jgi:hypothetical protein
MVGEGYTVSHEGPQIRQRDRLAKRAEQAIRPHLVEHYK